MVEETVVRKSCSMLKITSIGGENNAGYRGSGIPESVGCSFKQVIRVNHLKKVSS